MVVAAWPDAIGPPAALDAIELLANQVDAGRPSHHSKIPRQSGAIEGGFPAAWNAGKIDVGASRCEIGEVVPFQVSEVPHIKAAGSFGARRVGVRCLPGLR